MKFTIWSIVLAGLATAQVILTNSDYSGIEAGEPFTITWSDATGPVSLTLMNGPAGDLNVVSEIASSQSGESFTWTPPETLPSGTYAFEISDDEGINYSPRFQISGGAASSNPTVSTTSTTSAVSSTSVVSSTSATSVTSSSAMTSTASSTTASATMSGSSSSATMSSVSSSITSSMTTSSATTTMTTTMISSRTSSAASSGTPDVTEVPTANGARGVVAPLAAALLVAVGAAF